MSDDDESPVLQDNPLLKALEHLQKRVNELEVERRVDQDFIFCLTLLVEKPEALQKLWRLGISGVAADSALRWARLDEADQVAARYAKEASERRVEFWSRQIQHAIDLRRGSGDTDQD